MNKQRRPLLLTKLRIGPVHSIAKGSMLAIAMMTVVGVASGILEAGVLSLIAEVASRMMLRVSRVQVDLGLVTLRESIRATLILALALATARLLLQGFLAWIPARLASDMLTKMRERLFVAYAHASWEMQSHEREGHLQELMSNQTNLAANAVLSLASMITGAAMFAAMLASALALNVPVALIVVATASLLIFALRPVGNWGGRAARDLSASSMDQANGVNESVRLAEEINVFGVADVIRARVSSLVDAVSSSYYRTQFSLKVNQSLYQGLIFLLIVVGLAGIYASGNRHLATLGAVVLVLVRAGTYSQQMLGSFVGLKQALPYVDRVEEVASRYVAAQLPVGDEALDPITSVDLRQIGYHYRNSAAGLNDISVSVKAGERIGIVGPSGAGKSTLVQVLLRLRHPDGGSYEVNGKPADSYRYESWQQRVAYLPQDPQLIHATVAENIRFFRPLAEDQVEQAAKAAQVYEEIMAMPDGFETVISQRGDAVSGGQRQRICLARALASNPDMLVLDEPTSALDVSSEAAIHLSLAALPANVIIFVVAHRLSTLKMCDRLLVLQAGRVEASGDPADLVRNNAFYREAMAFAGTPLTRGQSHQLRI